MYVCLYKQVISFQNCFSVVAAKSFKTRCLISNVSASNITKCCLIGSVLRMSQPYECLDVFGVPSCLAVTSAVNSSCLDAASVEPWKKAYVYCCYYYYCYYYRYCIKCLFVFSVAISTTEGRYCGTESATTTQLAESLLRCFVRARLWKLFGILSFVIVWHCSLLSVLTLVSHLAPDLQYEPLKRFWCSYLRHLNGCFIKTKSSMCCLCAGVIVCVNKCGKFSDL